ncbi:MAG: mismatch repair protein MutL [Candidatus Petromonas sp.]|jgi:DNA mismatch repair protein MutL|nr:mismatch repair protein MutL [Candidatus Petromonas sp.]
MLKRIRKLDKNVSNKIAAGEVVERPASVVKELIENSIDAGSSSITVEIKDAGKSYIRISDNGSGIHRNDIALAFERHATSKIYNEADIFNVKSLGFRGEALASIASVSNMELITKTNSEDNGIRARLKNGEITNKEEVGCPTGTTIIVKDLFYNTPARYKFLKANSTETTYISSTVNKLALSHPKIAFKYIVDNKNIFTTAGNGDIYSTIYTIYGREIVKNLLKIDDRIDEISMQGYISNTNYTRGNRQLQILFVNGRYIKSKMLMETINDSYKTLLPVNRFPICFLYLDIPADKIDVNIHPAKVEIRFHDEKKVRDFVYRTIREKLLNSNLIPNVSIENKNKINSKSMPYKSENKNIKESFLINDKSEQLTINKELNPMNSIFNARKSKSFTNGNMISEDVDLHLKKLIEKANSLKIFSNESEEENPFERTLFSELNIIGQIFSTYIICEREDEMFLIDQHAAHERILYEKYLDSFINSEVVSQILLEPIVIDLNYLDKDILMQYKNIFSRLGYKVEEFGYNTIILREVPILFGKPVAESFFIELIEGLDENIKSNYQLQIERIIQQSCKNAIKAHDTLENIEIKSLINDLQSLENPFTCPHGRPIIISISKTEIEKKFMRT